MSLKYQYNADVVFMLILVQYKNITLYGLNNLIQYLYETIAYYSRLLFPSEKFMLITTNPFLYRLKDWTKNAYALLLRLRFPQKCEKRRRNKGNTGSDYNSFHKNN